MIFRTLPPFFRAAAGAAGILAVTAAAAPWATGQVSEGCRPIAPEIGDEVLRAGLPTQTTRWQLVERLWSEASPLVHAYTDQALATGSMSEVADLVQGRTNDALREAIIAHRDRLAASMLDLWLKPLGNLTQRDRYLAYYLTPAQRVSEVHLERPQKMWVEPNGIEIVLYPAIYLAGATDIALAVGQRPPPERDPAFVSFARDISEIALSHYNRWAFGPPVWQVRGWGCNASGLNLVEFTRRRAERSFDHRAAAYCVAPTDLDMLLMIGISNLLRLSKIAPDLAPLADEDRHRLANLLRLQARFMASRLVWGTVTDERGRSVATVDFDPGAWADHPDWSHAADEGMEFPTSTARTKAGVGRDISHGYRIAWMALSLADDPEVAGGTTDWNAVVDALARQFSYHVLDLNAAVPRFRNYLDGSNGWYRVNYVGRNGFGFPPYGLSRTYLEAAWARLAARDGNLLSATSKLWKALARPSAAECDTLTRTYVEGNFWKDRKPVVRPLSGPGGSLAWLPFAAVSPVP